MIKKFSSLIRLFVPPFIFLILKLPFKRRTNFFSGHFYSWSESIKNIKDGYESQVTFQNVVSASLDVKSGKALYERDGVCFYEEEFRWPVISSILNAKNLSRSTSFNVLDFGGSLGSFYNQHIKFLSQIDNLKWNIIEQKKLVEIGKDKFQNSILRFYESISEYKINNKSNLILLSSSIQYLEDPFKILEELIQLNPQFFIIDRTPFTKKNYDFVMHQNLPKIMGGQVYPAWFFSQKKFFQFFEKNNYFMHSNFNCEEDYGVGRFQGIVFQRKRK